MTVVAPHPDQPAGSKPRRMLHCAGCRKDVSTVDLVVAAPLRIRLTPSFGARGMGYREDGRSAPPTRRPEVRCPRCDSQIDITEQGYVFDAGPTYGIVPRGEDS
jgi:hypothetical protein